MDNSHIFRQYDVRGIVGEHIDTGVAQAIGRAYATVLRRRHEGAEGLRVALGRDNRLTSNDLAAAVAKGLAASGVDVVDVGTVPTPALSFAAAHLETDGGIQVTGSHNPPEYNGFKLAIGGASIYGEAIQEVRQLIETSDFVEGTGSIDHHDILPTYISTLAGKFDVVRPLKVVVDCGNGAGSVVAVDLLSALGANVEVVPLFCESDGTFPNHHPDPVVDKNLEDLISKVLEVKADLGIAFDGDADRIGAVDDKGNIVRGDILLLIYALDLLERKGAGQPIVFDVKCSQVLPEMIEKAGGRPVMSRTGHSLIKERMKSEGSLLAGELSGHIMFGEDYYGFDDAPYAACLLLAILSRRAEAFSEWLASFPQFVSTAEIRYPATEETKWAVVADAVEHFSKERDVVDVDGARVLFGDGWGLIRASNTEPVLVARYEARTAERRDEIRAEMERWLTKRGVSV